MMETLTLNSLRKKFPGVEALKGFSYAFKPGRIYGLVGENGAGKSTLVKILMGLHSPDEGEIILEDNKILIGHPTQARDEFGIEAVYQDQALIPKMSIAENLFLDRLHHFYDRGMLNYGKLEAAAGEVITKVGLELDVSEHIEDISEAEKSLIQLAKALQHDFKILILDEMTAPLVSSVVNRLFDIMLKLKQEGKTIIFISHRLEEVLNICDEILVLKDGNLEGVIDNTDKSNPATVRKQAVRMMTGTEKGLNYPPKTGLSEKGQAILSLRNICNSRLRGVSLDIHENEIVALAGLNGQGQSTLLRVVAGLFLYNEGDIILSGRSIKICNPCDAIQKGVFYLSDRRDEEELWLSQDICLNISVASICDRTSMGIIRTKYDRSVVQDMATNLHVESPQLQKIVRQLSGGNRQKVVIGKYLLAKPKILLMDQPTIGLDVGAKVEIYNLLRELAAQGIPTLTVLTDLEEVVNFPDRILVLHEGKIAGEFSGENINEEELLDSYYG